MVTISASRVTNTIWRHILVISQYFFHTVIRRKVLIAIIYNKFIGESDSDNVNWYKYVRITTNQPDIKSNLNPNPTIKQHAIVSI